MDVVVEDLAVVGEPLEGHLVEVGDGNAGRENGEVRVLGSIVGGSLGSELIKLSGGDTGVNTLDDLLRDANRIDKLGVGGAKGLGWVRFLGGFRFPPLPFIH